MNVRKSLIAILLRCLNSRLLNQTPCRYGHIGNCEAFDYSFLDSSDKQSPGVTVRQILDEADRFNSCPLLNNHGVTVIEPDGTCHEASPMELHELRVSLTPKSIPTTPGTEPK